MKFVLIGSLLVLLILMAVAYAMARTILRQKKLSQMKKDFINNMTHEFKTPIANIALAIDTIDNLNLLNGNGNGKLNNYLKIIGNENLRLYGNVEKILEISQLEEEKVTFLSETFSLILLLEEVAKSFDLIIQKKGGKLISSYESDNLIIKGDRTHLANMFHNLIDNAVKYNHSIPVIHINVRQKEEVAEIKVSDNGIGMSPDEQKHIFNPFYRIPTGNKHDVKGFGLGLSYVKKVISVHGGEINVESETGKGSSFVIRLPCVVIKNEMVLEDI
jgi:two-component system phosphate regulon sensor histidine kinase PhoR